MVLVSSFGSLYFASFGIELSFKIILNLKEIPKPDDAADALAVCITHGSSLKFKENFIMR